MICDCLLEEKSNLLEGGELRGLSSQSIAAIPVYCTDYGMDYFWVWQVVLSQLYQVEKRDFVEFYIVRKIHCFGIEVSKESMCLWLIFPAIKPRS